MTQKSLTLVKNVIFTQAEWACSQGKLIKRGKTDRMQFLYIVTLQWQPKVLCLDLHKPCFEGLSSPRPRGKPQGEEGKKRGPGNELGFALQLLPERQGRTEGKFFHWHGSDVTVRETCKLGISKRK